MDGYENNKPEEQGSTAEDFMPEVDQDIDYEPAKPEDVDGKCPDCGSNRITRVPRATAPDDYVYQYECLGCGTTWEN